jgi:hypothetical protein
MHQRIVTADGFYEDPLTVRTWALSAEYDGNLSKEAPITQSALEKLSYLAHNRVESVGPLPFGNFSLTTESKPLDPVGALPGVDWVAVVYLNLPNQAEGKTALSLYRHLRLNSERLPDPVEMRIQGWNNLAEVKAGLVDQDGLDNSCWQAWYTVYQRWNRVVLFDPEQWHRELKGFGDTINNCRLSQLFYLRNF